MATAARMLVMARHPAVSRHRTFSRGVACRRLAAAVRPFVALGSTNGASGANPNGAGHDVTPDPSLIQRHIAVPLEPAAARGPDAPPAKTSDALAAAMPEAIPLWGFTLLSVIYGCWFMLGVLVPGTVATAVLSPDAAAVGLNVSLVRLSGALAVVPLFVARSLQGATIKGLLASQTYRKLCLGLAAAGVTLAVGRKLVPAAVFYARHDFAVPTVAVFTATTAVYTLTRHTPDLWAGVGELTASLFAGSAATPLATSYTVLSLLAVSLAGLCIMEPLAVSLLLLGAELTWASVFLLRVVGALLIVIAVACACLRDAAVRGRLGASTFRGLNLSLGLAGFTALEVTAGMWLLGHLAPGPAGLLPFIALAVGILGSGAWAAHKDVEAPPGGVPAAQLTGWAAISAKIPSWVYGGLIGLCVPLVIAAAMVAQHLAAAALNHLLNPGAPVPVATAASVATGTTGTIAAKGAAAGKATAAPAAGKAAAGAK